VGLLRRPLKVRIEGIASDLAKKLEDEARESGLVLAAPGEEADLVAVPAGPSARSSSQPSPLPAAPKAPAGGRALVSPRLSRRELEILDYLADGWSNSEIASVLGLGERTVRFHLESLYAKLGVNRRGEAVREAARLGLVRFDF
jgi:DNA-binding CsgD family transcriptional regulator